VAQALETKSEHKLTAKKVLFLNPFLDSCIESTMEVVDFDPRGHFFLDTPLGLVFLYSYAKEMLKDIDFSVLDAHAKLVADADKGMEYNWNRTLDQIEEIAPSVIGISCCYYRASTLFHETCKRIKERFPEVVIIVGGNYPTDFCEQVLDDNNIDYVVLSEGEGPLVGFLKAYFYDGKMDEIPGLRYRTETGITHIFSEKSREHFVDLNYLPPLDRSKFPMDQYGHGRSPLDRIYGSKDNYRELSMCVSRGCPYECTFCNAMNFWDRKLRYRDTDSVLDEMEQLRDEYGATVVLINDDNFLLNKKRVTAICEGMIKRDLGLDWVANGGSNVRVLLDAEYLDLIIESGFCLFNLAIESGSQETLEKIKKPLDIDEVWQLVEQIRKKYPHMWLNGHFILGFPFETKQDILDTIKFSADLQLDWNTYSIFKPFPNTELYDYSIEHGFMEEFDPSCVDNISTIDGIDWKREWTTDIAYEANLQTNFFENTNLMNREKHLDQALRDFEYVISLMGGTHPLAYRQAAITAKRMGIPDKPEKYFELEKQLLKANDFYHRWYKKFNIPLPAV
jgi:anaerobic magnesium-protoporphyrin IX monomethyl ester cyclase